MPEPEKKLARRVEEKGPVTRIEPKLAIRREVKGPVTQLQPRLARDVENKGPVRDGTKVPPKGFGKRVEEKGPVTRIQPALGALSRYGDDYQTIYERGGFRRVRDKSDGTSEE